MGNTIAKSKTFKKKHSYLYREAQSTMKLNKETGISYESSRITEREEKLKKYEFTYDKIYKYITSSFMLSTADDEEKVNPLEIEVPSLDLMKFSQSELKNSMRIHPDDETSPIIITQTGTNKKFLLKLINFESNQEKSKKGNTSYDIDEKLRDLDFIESNQSYHNRDTFKELRIIRNHPHWLLNKCLGYFIEDNSKIYLVYSYLDYSIRNLLLEEKLSRLENKISLVKNILELVKFLHCEGIISLDLSIDTVRFNETGYLKLCSFQNSVDNFSLYDIDRHVRFFQKNVTTFDKVFKDIHFSPEILLKTSKEPKWQSDIWSLGILIAMIFSERIFEFNGEIVETYNNRKIPENFYNSIKHIPHIQSIVVGLLRFDYNQRPNIFEVIDSFNNLLKYIDYPEKYFIYYTKNEVLSKN